MCLEIIRVPLSVLILSESKPKFAAMNNFARSGILMSKYENKVTKSKFYLRKRYCGLKQTVHYYACNTIYRYTKILTNRTSGKRCCKLAISCPLYCRLYSLAARVFFNSGTSLHYVPPLLETKFKVGDEDFTTCFITSRYHQSPLSRLERPGTF